MGLFVRSDDQNVYCSLIEFLLFVAVLCSLQNLRRVPRKFRYSDCFLARASDI
jgi:hypothetical protein